MKIWAQRSPQSDKPPKPNSKQPHDHAQNKNLIFTTFIRTLTAMVNLLVGSASAKWAMLSPIFVPMLMILGFSPEFTQAAYRVGDSTTNIITPMMPYFPLVVVFCQGYVKSTGVGTVTSIMLPYSITFLVLWSAFLFLYWQLGLPLGINSGRLRIHRASRSGPLMNHSCKRVRPQAIRGRLCRFGQGPEPKIPV